MARILCRKSAGPKRPLNASVATCIKELEAGSSPARLPTGKQAKTHDPRCGRVHSPLSVTRPAMRVVKIRRFGCLANRDRSALLALCRISLRSRPAPVPLITQERQRAIECRCPICQEGRMIVIERINAREFARVSATPKIDTS